MTFLYVWVSAASQSNLGGSYVSLKAATGVKLPSLLLSCPHLRESSMRSVFGALASFPLVSITIDWVQSSLWTILTLTRSLTVIKNMRCRIEKQTRSLLSSEVFPSGLLTTSGMSCELIRENQDRSVCQCGDSASILADGSMYVHLFTVSKEKCPCCIAAAIEAVNPRDLLCLRRHTGRQACSHCGGCAVSETEEISAEWVKNLC